MPKVFLGGTCNGSTWREDIVIPQLSIEYFNPVVPDWNDEAYQRELHERETCDFCLYVITPKMTGVYSIAEAVDDSNKRPGKTIFAFINEDEGEVFTTHQFKSLQATAGIIGKNGGRCFFNIDYLIEFLNSQA